MTDTINVQIEIAIDEIDETTIRNSQWLQDLAAELGREIEVPYELKKVGIAKDTQAGDIVTAIALFNLSLAALGVMWSIIKVRRRGSITLEKIFKDGTKLVVVKGDLTDAELKQYEVEIIQDIEEKKVKQLQDLIIRVES